MGDIVDFPTWQPATIICPDCEWELIACIDGEGLPWGWCARCGDYYDLMPDNDEAG